MAYARPDRERRPVVRLVAPRPNFAESLTDAERAIMNSHAAYWRPHLERGDMVVFGPVLTDADSYGLAVVAIVRAGAQERPLAALESEARLGPGRLLRADSSHRGSRDHLARSSERSRFVGAGDVDIVTTSRRRRRDLRRSCTCRSSGCSCVRANADLTEQARRSAIAARLGTFADGQRAVPVRLSYSPEVGSFGRVERK